MRLSSSVCISESACHAAKGTGYLLGTIGSSGALVALAVIVAAVALGLLASDIYFAYSASLYSPLQLIWAVPVAIGFFVVDLMVIATISRSTFKAIKCLANETKHCAHKMADHFRASLL
jgi:hypothetical protein